jgi:hypothetical protein
LAGRGGRPGYRLDGDVSEVKVKTRDGLLFPGFEVGGVTIVTPYDLRDYASAETSDLSMGTRSLLRWLADRWEHAEWIDWDEVRPPHGCDRWEAK